jgi:hypothetical protein
MNRIQRMSLTAAVAILPLLMSVPVTAQTYYGSQLMTPEERAEHRARMQSLSPDEREAYRAQHHEAMKKRAEEMGVSIPDQPPYYGRGRGPGGRGYGYGYGRRGPWYGGSPYGDDYPGYGRRGFPCPEGPGYGGPGYRSWGPPRW